MDADWIITAFVLIDTLMERLGHRTDVRAQVPDSEVSLIAVAAATYVPNQHERAVWILRESRYLAGRIEVTRFNRRRHKRADGRAFSARPLGEVRCTGAVVVIASLPVPVGRRVRARRWQKVRGRAECGYCAASKAQFFGWRLHLIGTPNGIPVRFQVLPAAVHDGTPIHQLAFVVPPAARLFGDQACNSAPDATTSVDATGGRRMPVRRANMQPHEWFLDEIELRDYRHTIATVNSQCAKMGRARL